MQVSVEQFKSDPGSLVDRIEAGESIVLTRSGRPVAEIHPLHLEAKTQRPFGLCAGQFTVPKDFNSPLPEDIVNSFYAS